MQVFVPYPSPIDVAKCLDKKRLRKQIIECDQILKAIYGQSEAWKNHPVVNMYSANPLYHLWLQQYRDVLAFFNTDKHWMAIQISFQCDTYNLPFLTKSFCDQHKRRLYTKAPHLYPQFAKYGTSEDNWYVADGEIIKFRNGKRI